MRIKTAIEAELGVALDIDEIIFRKAAERCVSTILHDFAETLSLSSAPSGLNVTIKDTLDQGSVPPEVSAAGVVDIHGESWSPWNMHEGIFDFFPVSSTGLGEFEPRVSLDETRESLQSPHNAEKSGSDSGYGSHNSKGTGARTTEPG